MVAYAAAMKLSEWCEKNNAGPVDLAEWIDVTPQCASRYILGQRVPTPEKTVEIRSLTDGKVRADDLVDANIEYRGAVSMLSKKHRSGSKSTANRRQR
jgi:DNA-binding transcriptional regulator YdaS (Cro superfamily)